MPIYEYRCDKGHTFEVMQRMSDDPVTECEVCGAPVQRVFHPVAVHFKGSGFYNTDYGKQKRGGAAADGDSAGDGKPGDGKSGDSSTSDKASKSDKSDKSDGGSKAKETSSSSSTTATKSSD
jgi:putative FmdB family regulatory protein